MKKKRRIHKIIAFLLTATVLLVPPCSVFATTVLPSNLAETANEFLMEVLDGKPYDRYQYLTNVDGETAYVLFQVSEGGYAIVDIQNNEVVEGAAHLHPYFKNRSADYCYNGPLNYYRVNGEKLINLVTQETYDISSVPLIQADRSREVTVDTSENIRAVGDYTQRLSGSVRNLYWSAAWDTMCPAVAVAMFFLYYEEYVSPGSGYVDNAYIGSGAVYFPDHLASGNYGLNGGRTAEETRLGMQTYITRRGKSKTMTCIAYTGTRFKNQINAGKPVVVGLYDHPNYNITVKGHWVVGYGYYVKKDPNVSYILANDGQGRTGVHINPTYVDYLLY